MEWNCSDWRRDFASLSRSASSARLRAVISSAVNVTPIARSSGTTTEEARRTSMIPPSFRFQRHSTVPVPETLICRYFSLPTYWNSSSDG